MAEILADHQSAANGTGQIAVRLSPLERTRLGDWVRIAMITILGLATGRLDQLPKRFGSDPNPRTRRAFHDGTAVDKPALQPRAGGWSYGLSRLMEFTLYCVVAR
jgi:hypothetical protein